MGEEVIWGNHLEFRGLAMIFMAKGGTSYKLIAAFLLPSALSLPHKEVLRTPEDHRALQGGTKNRFLPVQDFRPLRDLPCPGASDAVGRSEL